MSKFMSKFKIGRTINCELLNFIFRILYLFRLGSWFLNLFWQNEKLRHSRNLYNLLIFVIQIKSHKYI